MSSKEASPPKVKPPASGLENVTPGAGNIGLIKAFTKQLHAITTIFLVVGNRLILCQMTGFLYGHGKSENFEGVRENR